MVRRVIAYEVRAWFYELVCAGASLESASRSCGVAQGTGRAWWRGSGLVSPVISFGRVGGLPGTAPAPVPGTGGRDSPAESPQRRVLTSEDRAVIAAGVRAGWTHARIGRELGRHRSVITREVARNRGPDGSYWAPVAHRAAHERRRRPKAFKLVIDPGLCRRIEAWMDDGWSPGLIAAMLRAQTVDTRMGRVSHETIYRALYVQTRGSLRRDLTALLSTRRRARKPHGSQRNYSPYREAFTIRERPAEAADRAVPGHWEGDLVLGAGGTSAVGTLVERTTRYVLLLHLPGRHDADSVAAAMINQMSRLPEHLRRSLTWDRGVELAGYRDIQLALDMPVYFCDPHSPWQRGSNENTNRLLRFWLEKGTDLSQHSAEDLDRIAATLNARPRPTLDLKTPAQALAELLANPVAA